MGERKIKKFTWAVQPTEVIGVAANSSVVRAPGKTLARIKPLEFEELLEVRPPEKSTKQELGGQGLLANPHFVPSH